MVSDDWTPLRPGIERKPLALDRGRGIQIDIIRLKPNFKDNPHYHSDLEWVYVLQGSFSDSKGLHRKGDFIVNTTEELHQPTCGKEGCTLLIVWTGSIREAK